MCLGFYLTSVSSDARCGSQHRMSASTLVSCRIRILATRLSASLARHPRIEPRASSSGFRSFILSNCTGLVRIRAFHSLDSVFPCPPASSTVSRCNFYFTLKSTFLAPGLSPKAATPPEEEEQPEPVCRRAGNPFSSRVAITRCDAPAHKGDGIPGRNIRTQSSNGPSVTDSPYPWAHSPTTTHVYGHVDHPPILRSQAQSRTIVV
eukprot:jgi/Botrbrau1/21/Bobra.0022s0017.1